MQRGTIFYVVTFVKTKMTLSFRPVAIFKGIFHAEFSVLGHRNIGFGHDQLYGQLEL